MSDLRPGLSDRRRKVSARHREPVALPDTFASSEGRQKEEIRPRSFSIPLRPFEITREFPFSECRSDPEDFFCARPTTASEDVQLEVPTNLGAKGLRSGIVAG